MESNVNKSSYTHVHLHTTSFTFIFGIDLQVLVLHFLLYKVSPVSPFAGAKSKLVRK